MKNVSKHLMALLPLSFLFGTNVNAQYNTTWYTNPSPAASAISNTTSAGYIGIGTRSSNGTANTPLPAFNLHLHGTADYTYTVVNPFPQAPISSPQGKTTRIGLTNTTTGMTETDGTVIRMSENDFFIENHENGNATLSANNGNATLNANGISLNLHGSTNRAWVGSTFNSNAEYSKFNIIGNTDNCLYLKAPTGKYGLSVRSGALTDNALQVVGTDASIVRFSVKANGNTEIVTTSATANDKLFVIKTSGNNKLLQVTGDGILRSREIIVDALTWADYVFEPNYQLMPLNEVRTYISENRHLPHVPSTAEVAETGVNLVKTDAILLEKIEELTLYLLQQDEKMKLMQAELDTLKKEQTGNK